MEQTNKCNNIKCNTSAMLIFTTEELIAPKYQEQYLTHREKQILVKHELTTKAKTAKLQDGFGWYGWYMLQQQVHINVHENLGSLISIITISHNFTTKASFLLFSEIELKNN